MLDAAGKFAFPGLLPGTYSLDIRLVDHVAEPRTIIIGDKNVNGNRSGETEGLGSFPLLAVHSKVTPS
jgi:hypothetical protein